MNLPRVECMAIKNIVFDVGNVLVQWNPVSVISNTFPEIQDPLHLAEQIFRTAFWLDLNLGKISEQEAIQKFHHLLNVDKKTLEMLMQKAKESLLPVTGSIELVKDLHEAGYPLYVITDNTKEIMSHLKQKYDFWNLFLGVVVSAEIGHLKPSPHIYKYLLETYHLRAEETLFLDDIEANVKGAKAVDMVSIQFTTVEKCILDLKKLKVKF